MRAAGFAVYAAVMVLMPVAVVAWGRGADAPFWFLAGDAYLYLGIGQSSSGWSMSFDSLRPTNGFHPLWQVWVRLMVEATGGEARAAMWAVVATSVLLVWGGVLALGAAIARFTGSWLLAMLAVPGVYYLAIGQTLHNLPVWAFLDGMEAALAFALAALFLLVLGGVREPLTGGRTAVLGVLLALIVLTRLDEVFVVFAIVLAVLAWPGQGPWGTRIARAAMLGAPAGLALALFIGWSLATTGLPVPVSGAAKGEGALLANAWVTLATLFAPIIDLREGLTGYVADREALLGGAFRVVELVVPALFAAGFALVVLRRHATQAWAPVLAGLCGGVVLKALYTGVQVNYWHQASWYFAVAMAVMTLGAAILLGPAARRLRRVARAVAAAVLVTLGLLHASLWSARLMTDPTRPAQRDFWADRAAIETALAQAAPGSRLLEFGDGMLNFTLDLPVRHGFVFAGDAGSLESLRAGRLLRDSVADGFDLLSSYEYLRVPAGAEDWDSARIRDYLRQSFLDPRVKAELEAFDFAMIHVHRPSGVPFIRLIPRAG